jgi:hypothetical protein
MIPNEERREVEALAQSLYDQSLYETEDPAGIAWVKRAQIVREPWLQRARQQLRTMKILKITKDPE